MKNYFFKMFFFGILVYIIACGSNQLYSVELTTSKPESSSLLSSSEPINNTDINHLISVRPYGYSELKQDIDRMRQSNQLLKTEIIGKSSSGADILMVKLGHGTKEVFISGAWHGDEWITALFLSKLVESISYNQDANYDWNSILERLTLYIVPMVNPDGCEISVHKRSVNPYLLEAIEHLAPAGFNLSQWRANALGVDPNKQFPVNWDALKIRLSGNIPPRGTAGDAPLSIAEAKCTYDFTLQHNFIAVFAYHSQGELLYWNTVPGQETKQMRTIADIYAQNSGYQKVNDHTEFAGGYRDWFVLEYQRPGLTVELGRGNNPLPLSAFDAIWHKNYNALYQCLYVLSNEIQESHSQ